MSDRLLKESDVMRIAFQLPLVVNSAFADAVKALPSADRPQEWIPCSERLPEEHTEVLLLGIKNMMVGYWQEGDFGGERAWRIMSGDGWETDSVFPPDVFEPIAWMPLPKPWKGATDE